MALLALAPKLIPSSHLGTWNCSTSNKTERLLKREVKQILFLVKNSRVRIQEWWLNMLLISAPGRWSLEGQEFRVIFGFNSEFKASYNKMTRCAVFKKQIAGHSGTHL